MYFVDFTVMEVVGMIVGMHCGYRQIVVLTSFFET